LLQFVFIPLLITFILVNTVDFVSAVLNLRILTPTG